MLRSPALGHNAHVATGMPDLEFRAGSSVDVEAIATLIERENNRPADRDRIARRLAGLPSVVVYDGAELVAFIHVRRFSPDIVELSNMVVARRHRRSGIGSAVVAMLEPRLVAAGYRAAIFVNCRLHPGTSDARVVAARAFWLRMGYEICFATGGSAVFVKTLDGGAASA